MKWLELECYENHYIIKAVVCIIEREGKAQKSWTQVTDRLETRGVFRGFFREKPELYGVWRRVSALESPNASLHVHAVDRAWTVTDAKSREPRSYICVSLRRENRIGNPVPQYKSELP